MDVSCTLGIVNEYCSLDDLEKLINDVRMRIDFGTYERIYLEFEIERGYYDSVSVEVKIIGTRPETEEETLMREQRKELLAYERIKFLEDEIRKLRGEDS